MKLILKIETLLMFAFLVSCKHDEFDAKNAAKKYCECLQTERASGKDFFEAKVKCEGELLSTNRFYRIYYTEMTYGRYSFFLSPSLIDSTKNFNSQFSSYIEDNCCKEAIPGCDRNDTLQLKRKGLDSGIFQ